MTVAAQGARRTPVMLEGYALLAVTYLVWGSIGALVRYADAPESVLIVVRMLIAVAVLGALFARRATFAELRTCGVRGRLLLMGIISPTCLLLFFVTLRLTDVAIGMFLLFMAPVYVALLAPRLMGQRPDRIVAPALVVALAGMVAILFPALVGAGDISLAGLACGVATGLLFAAYQLIVKSVSRQVRSSTIVLVELTCVIVFLLPLALWQAAGMDQGLTQRDWISAVAMGLFATALAYMLYIEGVRRVRVEHASILGYLEPVSAPLYALVLLGEAPAATTLAGGALIVLAGLLIVRYGAADLAPEPGRPPLEVPSGREADAGGAAGTAAAPLARDAGGPRIR
jgi:drug/metabolite transporter (DMT)-like permease